jgi:uncharacterized protein with HEPN domain
MLDAAERIDWDLLGFDLPMFERVSTTRDAVSMNLIVIGEGAVRLSPELKAQAPAVRWGDLIGLRNRLAHAYARTDPKVVFEAATLHVPELVTELKRLFTLPSGPD